ncbi:unnamed protein product [Clonostachys rosea f. rosea IK726]|uniref:Uncharacterized protein n=1 Tax=Clonostachys rosea f. rosea IK726 TaxID=1349383 RepID=A0ACA9TSF4_BIOOC|nr:unnamed protein product [Clonostachys rosea f. rosea IK726]
MDLHQNDAQSSRRSPPENTGNWRSGPLFFKTTYTNTHINRVYASLQLIVERAALALTRATGALVHLGGDGVSDVGKLLLLFLEVLSVGVGTVLLKPLVGLLDSVEDLLTCLLLLISDLATETVSVVDLVLQAESVVLKTVASLNALTGGLVLLGVLLSLGNHALNLLRSKTTLVVGDGDGLLLASSLVVGGNLEDTVGVKAEGDLDLGNTTRGRGDTGKLELAEDVVVLGQRSLTLEDLDQDHGLVVSGGREDLALAGRDLGVTADKLGHNSTGGLDTESKRVDIHEEYLLGTLLTGKNTSLDGSTESDSFIGVDALGSLLAVEEALNEALDLGDTGGTTDEDNVVNLGLLDIGVLENLLDRLQGLLEEVDVELLELGAGESLREVIALPESLNLNAGAHLRRQSALGLLSLALELTHGLGVLGDVNAVLLVVGLGQVVDDALVEIFTTEMEAAMAVPTMARGENRRAIQQRRPRPKAIELLDERAIVVVFGGSKLTDLNLEKKGIEKS